MAGSLRLDLLVHGTFALFVGQEESGRHTVLSNIFSKVMITIQYQESGRPHLAAFAKDSEMKCESRTDVLFRLIRSCVCSIIN